jgi:transcriptional regulator with XRE-family HTH domain
MRLSNAIGDTIRILRTDKSLTLRQVSDKSSVSLGHLSEIEKGKKNASNEVLEAIAFGLDITTTRLMGEIYTYLDDRDE